MALFDIGALQTRENLLYTYTESQLYSAYCSGFTIGDILSPFGDNTRASFGFYIRNDNGAIWWKDQRNGKTGDVIEFIRKVYDHRGIRFREEKEFIERVFYDLRDQLIVPVKTDSAGYAHNLYKRREKKVDIEIVKTAEGTIPSVFMPFWEGLGITSNILDAYYTGFADEVWIYKTVDGNKQHWLWGRSTNDNPIFFYFFPKTGHVKVYRPFETEHIRKWIMNCNNTDDVQGLEQCDIVRRRPWLLVITKSMKEVMFLRSLGIDAIAFHGERHKLSKEFVAWLRKYCRFIIGLYDNDIPGIRGAIYLRDTHDVPIYFIPTVYDAKDPTDMHKKDKFRLFLLIEILNLILKRDYPNQYTGIGNAAFSGVYTR